MLSEMHKLRKEGKIIGFTASTFDMLHAGHCVMLSEAKSHCDYLIVGLLVDPTKDRPQEKNKPIQSIFERWVQAASISDIDLVIPFETEQDLEDMLLTLMPDVRVMGEEYKGTNHTGSYITGITNIYNNRSHSFSTSELRDRVKEHSENTEKTGRTK